MLNIFAGAFCMIVAGLMTTLALLGDSDSPRLMFALLAILNLSLGVLNLAKGFGGGA